VHRAGGRLADDDDVDLDADLLALVHEEEVDVLDDLADRVALDVADDRELLVALDVDREESVRVLEREERLVAREGHVQRVGAVPVEDGGDEALAARAARGALAEVGAQGCGELDVRHGTAPEKSADRTQWETPGRRCIG